MKKLHDRLAALGTLRKTVVGRSKHHGLLSGYTLLKWSVVNLVERILLFLFPSKRVECPCCGWTGPLFLTIDCGRFTVPAAECPHCRAHERHRALHLFLTKHDPGFAGRLGRTLHFAPEWHMRNLLEKQTGRTIVSVDYAARNVAEFPPPKFQTDMMHLGLASGSMDLIVCLHVLEHVPDDRAGIAEMHRVLKPGGYAYLMVPFMWDWKESIEFGAPDPTIYDHVRGYSINDFKQRLEPFVYEEIHPRDYLAAPEAKKYGIPPSQIIYRCLKPER